MVKLTDLKGSENLPKKWTPMKHLVKGDPRCEGVNYTIDQYNSLSIDGDVEELAQMLYKIDYPESTGITTQIGTDTGDRRWFEEKYFPRAKFIIANLDKFVVIRKG